MFLLHSFSFSSVPPILFDFVRSISTISRDDPVDDMPITYEVEEEDNEKKKRSPLEEGGEKKQEK